MKSRVIVILSSVIFALSSCGGSQVTSEYVQNVPSSYQVKGNILEMVELEGGTFAMGTMPDKRLISGAETANQVVIDGFAISRKPVSQALWKAVMGSNPSSVENDAIPVDMVDYKDAEKFVQKLSKITSVPFIISTEEMWEFAQKSGSLQLYDGTKEWCATDVEMKVARTAKEREDKASYTKAGGLVFRVAVLTGKPCPQKYVDMVAGVPMEREQSCTNETISVNGVDFKMVAVKGGSFMMGATTEQGQYAEDDEKPASSVQVEDFEIATTEVTVAQWAAVMDVLPLGNYASEPNKPVINVSWYAAQEYILKLREITGRKFRLPSEKEWEYAARGGSKGNNYRYAGSNQVASVAVYAENAKDLKVRDVKTKSPNELMVYDMCGNAWEWCQDSYAIYGEEPADANVKIIRGGSAASRWDACRVSNRSGIPADNTKGTFGFRLAI